MRNGGFELNADYWTLRGWNHGGKQEIESSVKATQLGQKSSLRVIPKGINGNWGTTITSQTIDVEPNSQYILSSLIKTEKLKNASAYFIIHGADEKENWINEEVYSNINSKVTGTTDWTKRLDFQLTNTLLHNYPF
ncbi:carbohydrate binding domain-containing protein [Bacillus sp. DX4.1]|uniref:carbohydrate binding domain-containing protein n=1 Tax=Bacillus sp. DX4.1 TaxID=3055867 RepID=UPI0025A0471F|nr:carbohydrate binding domain-containing protein [Bacillus sp. DX4.1]MDM5188014.1 carbohydrate binding domain-containing protein [Bacillus sp. DX4.1]